MVYVRGELQIGHSAGTGYVTRLDVVEVEHEFAPIPWDG
jgi:hypothetical protein